MANHNSVKYSMEDELYGDAKGVNMNSVLDIVLDDLDDMLSSHIPPNTSYPYLTNNNSNNTSSSWSTTSNTSTSPVNSINNSTNTSHLKPEFKDHVFISKECTLLLSQYIISENWGKQGVLLYKYLDYIFRCQLFDNQVTKITDYNNNIQYLIFHTGLQRRYDNEYLYVLLYQNYININEKWRIQLGNISNSFLSKHELILKLKQYGIDIENHLPKQTLFYEALTDCIYNPMYPIKVSWEERLITNRDRIYQIIGNDAFFDSKRKYLKLTELITAFDSALNDTKQMIESNPSIVVPQGFVDTKRHKYRMELLLPLYVDFNEKLYTFALAIGLNNKKCYSVKSVLTLKMAYANARLIGAVNSNWLRHGLRN